MSHSPQRAQLSKFLKNCRARVSPSDAGLPEPDRRRTAGLRREDVAALAGVSVTWYTWLEQGRDVHVSANVLERISSTLRLSDEERDYLFTLAQNRPPPLAIGKPDKVAPAILRMIEALDVPALVMSLRWDVVAWNELYAKAIRDYSELPPDQRNLARILFTRPEYRIDEEEYEAMVRRVVPKLRVDYSQAGCDPDFEALIDELNEASSGFQRAWRDTTVMARSYGINVVRHATLGKISFEHTSYVPEGHPALRLVIYVPQDAAVAEKIAKMRTSSDKTAQARRSR
jgi:transcriptional regulator with XRE-family HTH domain